MMSNFLTVLNVQKEKVEVTHYRYRVTGSPHPVIPYMIMCHVCAETVCGWACSIVPPVLLPDLRFSQLWASWRRRREFPLIWSLSQVGFQITNDQKSTNASWGEDRWILSCAPQVQDWLSLPFLRPLPWCPFLSCGLSASSLCSYCWELTQWWVDTTTLCLAEAFYLLFMCLVTPFTIC